MKIDLNNYFKCEVMKKVIKNRPQVVAMSMPFIIQEEMGLTIVYGDRGLVYLQDREGVRYKVACSTGSDFNLFPSFTKGYGRSAVGCSPHKEFEKERVNKILLVSIDDQFVAEVNSIAVKNIPKSGVVHVCKK